MLPQHVYVHVPFCARRCSYCDFSIAVRSNTPVPEFLSALAQELRLRTSGDRPTHASFASADEPRSAHPHTDVPESLQHMDVLESLQLADVPLSPTPLKTLYFGGGTPSRLGGQGIADAINIIRAAAPFAEDIELTIEANPDDVTPQAAATWAAAGVNRVSLGVQSFNDTVLSWMHRTHSASQAKTAVEILKDAGITNISVDLIFALPVELDRDWPSDVDQALALAPDHVSLYGLTVEPHTPLARWQERGTVHEAPEDRYESDFLHAHTAFTAAGFEHYEVSNYGRPFRHSRHNSSYWSDVPYLGLGPSAHSFAGNTRSWNVAPYTQWLQRLRDNQSPIDDSESLTPENRNAERVYLGLRTTRGLQASEAEFEIARSWISPGWAIIYERTIVLTPLGWLRLDALAASLTAAESR